MPHNEDWLWGEASLEEIFADPIVRLVMQRDGLDEKMVRSALAAASKRKNSGLASTPRPR